MAEHYVRVVIKKQKKEEMRSKLYSKQLIRYSIRKIPISRGKSGEYRLAVRDLDSNYSKSGGEPIYILSNQSSNFAEIESKLKAAETAEEAITIEFVKRFGKKWINYVL